MVEKCGPINILCKPGLIFQSPFTTSTSTSWSKPLFFSPDSCTSLFTGLPAATLEEFRPFHRCSKPPGLSHLTKAKSSSKPVIPMWSDLWLPPPLNLNHSPLSPLTAHPSFCFFPSCIDLAYPWTCQAYALLSPFSLLRTLFMQVPTSSTTSSSSGLGSSTNFWWCLPWPLLKL